jgi:putative MATE family efflux protein
MAEAESATTTIAALDFDEARLPRLVMNLAWPALVEELGLSLLGIVDTILVGQLIGSDALAAVGLGTLLFWLPMAGSMAIVVGTTAVIARDTGAGQVAGIHQALRDSLALALVWGTLVAVLMIALAEPAMHLMGAEEDVLPLGVTFMRAAGPGLAVQSLIFAGGSALRGAGDTRTPMVVTLFANVVNLALAYFLISGALWAPELGVLGSGLAYTVANTLGALLVMAFFVRGRSGLHYDLRRAAQLSRQGIRRILNVGLPAGFQEIQFQIAFMIYARIVAGLGTKAYAAHTVALRAEGLAIMPGFAFGIAAATLVGQALGGRRVDAAERAAGICHFYSTVFMVSTGVVLLAAAPQVTRIFTDDSEVIDIGADLLRIFAFALPGLGTSAALGGGLRGAGDTRAVMGIYTGCAWLLRIPVAFVFAIPLGMGAQGAWLGSVVDNSVRGLAIWFRFRQSRWKAIKV